MRYITNLTTNNSLKHRCLDKKLCSWGFCTIGYIFSWSRINNRFLVGLCSILRLLEKRPSEVSAGQNKTGRYSDCRDDWERQFWKNKVKELYGE